MVRGTFVIDCCFRAGAVANVLVPGFVCCDKVSDLENTIDWLGPDRDREGCCTNFVELNRPFPIVSGAVGLNPHCKGTTTWLKRNWFEVCAFTGGSSATDWVSWWLFWDIASPDTVVAARPAPITLAKIGLKEGADAGFATGIKGVEASISNSQR